ncbi:hypothetical protein [Streptomyces specialis]|uniref:hypothetical protein n=1 Tax=Streptomyces specialis TaxID=498367 RepID=UPI00073EB97D|nr:hypothetical protein [Streptomyces specialis]
MVALFNRLGEWQTARRTPTGRVRRNPPGFTSYIDIGPVLAIAATRLTLGAAVAMAFGGSGQINGGYAAITVGATAPALLAQLGQIPGVRNALGDAPVPGEPSAPVMPAPLNVAVPPIVPSQGEVASEQ